jgi:hypothetical protein
VTFERVHMIWDIYDGPRTGLADYRGRVHAFACEWAEPEQYFSAMYSLSPIDEETMSLAVEQWGIYRRWEVRFHRGELPLETHPASPGQDQRYAELDARIKERVARAPVAARAEAQFRPLPGQDDLPAGVLRELEVEWRDAT